MDQITLDVTDVPDAQVGDPVTLIGVDGNREQSADSLAAQAGTISYDLLTGILPRVPRIYLRNGGPVAAMTLLTGPNPERIIWTDGNSPSAAGGDPLEER
jgi:hypothetical protein